MRVVAFVIVLAGLTACDGGEGARSPDSDSDADADSDVDADCGEQDTDGDRDGYSDDCLVDGDDCDDDDPEVHPGAADALGDGRDTNSDGADGVDVDRDGSIAESPAGDDCDDEIRRARAARRTRSTDGLAGLRPAGPSGRRSQAPDWSIVRRC